MRSKITYSVLVLLTLGGFLAELILGPVHIPVSAVWNALFDDAATDPAWQMIVTNSRLPRALTALFAGSGLALCGLFMQTYFRNPLAGPSVLGISSGASLGVALVVLLSGGTLALMGTGTLGSTMAIAIAAGIGAFATLGVILIVARKMNVATLLIFGLMLGYITSSIIILLQKGASQEALQSYIYWGMGTFANTYGLPLYVLIGSCLLGFIATLFLLRNLNAMLLGANYAASMGVPVKKVGVWMLIIAGSLTGVITAFCGPVAFLGLAVPHVARGVFGSSQHRLIVPAVLLIGAVLGLFCDLITRIPWGAGVPLNAVTSLVGAPIVLWVIIRNRKLGSFL